MRLDWPLTTERLALRTLEVGDANGPYAAWMHDAEVTRYLEIRFAPPDAEALLAFVDRMNASPADLLLGLVRHDTGSHIGNIRLGPVDPHHGRAAIGILIGDRSAWGQGFAGEAIAALSDHALHSLGLAKLTAGLYAPNESSRRAFEKAGFHVDSARRAHAVLDGRRVDVIEMARFAP